MFTKSDATLNDDMKETFHEKKDTIMSQLGLIDVVNVSTDPFVLNTLVHWERSS